MSTPSFPPSSKRPWCRIFPNLYATTILCFGRPFIPCHAHLLSSPFHAALSRIAPVSSRPFSTLRSNARNYDSSAEISSSFYERSHRSNLPPATLLQLSSVDVEIASENAEGSNTDSKSHTNAHQDGNQSIIKEQSTQNSNLLQWKDILPISIYAAICLVGAVIVSTYEDYDVTHVRPNPSTIRRPTQNRFRNFASTSSLGNLNFIGAATKGMGWGPSDRGVKNLKFNNPDSQRQDDSFGEGDNGISKNGNSNKNNNDDEFFEEWYGSSATTLQSIPSYNEIMLQHRMERIPRWNRLDAGESSMVKLQTTQRTTSPTTEELKDAVLQLYRSLEELDDLKQMADEYMWDDIKDRLSVTSIISTVNEEPSANSEITTTTLRATLEYSMDTLKAIPSFYANGGSENNNNVINNDIIKVGTRELQTTIGFDWGSCAWRHCGAKADAQEALAELYSSVGMLEPFECRFIIDIIERSIRDVLAAVPTNLLPEQKLKPYAPYLSQAENDEAGMGLDMEYAKALNDLRVDLSLGE
mmetsp:Transcript_9470/g.20444  ORF Transcript_9470/g.20444 Transcript_9470/m.20444 type:complete len:527 (-) Transcript_9470:235-1815(-)|eukprot:CAMPEP_0171339268 /NCGR_PEP_ID=MMETSP0878-20121228/7851_1 /TAXON_ID=67004 /ORGANISM="Thalassiosira weissflogii, Strain CCMP1336" /LENGTH=526 /DNA_ID=CAMNT_0011841169 /DNA_START=11 /DNA_END=1591 /DNA_ORIENTATION=+